MLSLSVAVHFICPPFGRGGPGASPGKRLAAWFVLVLLAWLVLPGGPVSAQDIRGEASFKIADGYGRLTFKFSQSIDTQIRVSGNVLLIAFRQPVSVAVDRINAGASDWIGAARRDPDGRALRFALARKFKVNHIAAAEWLFVDLLPEAWSGEPPGLPSAVVEELSRRAREAEQLKRKQAEMAAKHQVAPVRVLVANHVTFTRYIFELPELTGVSADRGKDQLTLKFGAPLKFDLADSRLNEAAAVASIAATRDDDSAEVRFKFSDTVDVRSFREDFNYVVDVTPAEIRPKPEAMPPAAAKAAPPGLEAPARAAPDRPAVAPKPMAEAASPADAPPQTAAPPPGPPAAKPAQATANDGPPAAPSANEAAIAAKEAPPPAAPEVAPSPPATLEVAPPPAAAADARPAPPAAVKRTVAAQLERRGDDLQLRFAFETPTPAAILQRAD